MTTNGGSPLDGSGAGDLSRQGPREVVWGDGRRPDPSTICSKRRTNGEPCRKTAIKGTQPPLCASHGGNAPAVRAKARLRLENAADRMAKQLLGIASDEETPLPLRLSAIRDVLDRTGITAKTAVEVEVGPTPAWKEVFDAAILGGSRAESRARRGIADDGGAVLDAEVVGLDDDDEAASLLDGAGNGITPTRANPQAPQRQSETSDAYASSSTGTGSGTRTSKTGQRVTDEMRGSRVDANYPPIVSLAEAHPDDEPPRRIRTNERNRARTPRMSNGKKRRSE